MLQLRRKGKSWAFLVALMTMFALVVPFVGVATASHTTADNTHDLDVTPETDDNPTGTTHTLTASVTEDGGGASAGTEVDFENESGPAITPIVGGGGAGGSTDLSCITDGSGTCQVSFRSDAGGTNTIRGWVDEDQDNVTADRDASEGQAEGTTPGSRTEPDDTDVVAKTWFGALSADATLDCEPEEDLNATGESHTVECHLFDDNGAGTGDQGDGEQTGEEPDLAGFNVDGENLTPAVNDPDNSAAAGTADYSCSSATNSAGDCTATVSGAEAQPGTADLCFWADPEPDTAFDPAGSPDDGGECDTEAAPTDPDADSNQTDRVEKTWRARGTASNIDVEPESDQNATGTSHSVTATVTDDFGDPVAGARVDFDISNRNDGADPNQDNTATNSAGQVTFTYTDTGPAGTDGQDDITGYIDNNDDDAADVTDGESSDTVQKFWFAGGPPAVDEIILDNDGFANCDGGVDDTNSVGETHELCAEVLREGGTPIPGEPVTFTLDGPGEFVDPDGDFGDDDRCDDNDGAGGGDTFTTNANASGQAFAAFCSEESGDTEVTASADSEEDTGTKTWTPLEPRNIDCEPETASNPPGTSHVVTCDVVDRFGNDVPNHLVLFEEGGPGRIDGDDSDFTNDEGEAEVVVSSTENEEGTQSITAELEEDEGEDPEPEPDDRDDECDQLAGDGEDDEDPAPGSPDGNCEDTVEKTWTTTGTGDEECNDGVDNDGDGFIDFPNDPECESPEDDDEGPETGAPCNEENAIVGTDGNDSLVGTPGDDIICGLAGDDAIDGRGGKDIILGQGDDDTIDGAGGRDDIRGGKGRDVVSGGGGKDQIAGGKGADQLDGNNKNDVINGGAGRDTVRGNKGRDTLRGGTGADTLRGGRGPDIIRGGKGRDVLRGGRGSDFLDGGPGVDDCRGGPGNDTRRRCE